MLPQVPACDRCAQGVMDATNPHLLGTCGCACHASRVELELRYHVPRSQVWAGSRGGQSGNVHLHVRGELVSGRLRRRAGAALCSSRPAWWEREPSPGELERLPAGACSKCLELADRHGLELPAELGAGAVPA